MHVVAGVLLGSACSGSSASSTPRIAKTYDPRRVAAEVVPELMPRALYLFRLGAVMTFVTGVALLAVVVYYAGGALVESHR